MLQRQQFLKRSWRLVNGQTGEPIAGVNEEQRHERQKEPVGEPKKVSR